MVKWKYLKARFLKNHYKIFHNAFWLYFLFIIIISFIFNEVQKVFAYIFWLLLGIYIGIWVARKAINQQQSED